MKICIIIPCFNEEKRIDDQKFLKFVQENKNIRFCFVNDGSSDHTFRVLQKLTDSHDQFSLINIEKNIGKAGAVRLGVLKNSNSDSDYIGYWDADLATPLSEIEEFKKLVMANDYEIILGSRILRLGGKIERKARRHYLGRICATVVSLMLDLPIYDSQCGAKIFSKNLAKKIFQEKFISKWLFDVELIFRCLTIMSRDTFLKKSYEFPLNGWIDIPGSKIKMSDFFKVPIELLFIYKKYKNAGQRITSDDEGAFDHQKIFEE